MQNIQRALPVYTQGEENFNALSHAFGAVLSMAAFVVLVSFAARTGDRWRIAGCTVYGVALVWLYTASAVYHATEKGDVKKVLQTIDHCSVFLLIAGTYTPFALITLREQGIWGWLLFLFAWICSIFGMSLKIINFTRFSKLSMAFYVGTGWGLIFAFGPLMRVMDRGGILLLLAGGISYTVGVVLYGFGQRIRYMHSIFHVLVLLGSTLHYFCILFYVLP